MRKKRTLYLVVLPILLFMMALTLFLCACGDTRDKKEKTKESDPAVVTVDFDQNAEYTMASLDTLSDILDVKIMSDGVSRKADFTVKSSALSADGKYLEVIIVVEGIEKAIRLPYIDEAVASIRTDLRPLYDTIMKEGDKGISLVIKGSETEYGESAPIEAIVNLPNEGTLACSLAIGGDDPEVIARYKEGALTLFGLTVDAEKLMERIDRLAGLIDDEEVAAEESDSERSAVTITDAFVAVSGLLDTLDLLSEASQGSGFSHENGRYRFSCGSGQASTVLHSLIEDREILDLIDLFEAFLDTKTAGAMRANRVFFDLTFGVTSTGMELTFVANNVLTARRLELSVSMNVYDHLLTLPEAEEKNAYDLEWSIPFALPQNDVDLTIKTKLCVSDMFDDEGDNVCAVTTVTDEEGDTLVRFVLGEDYACLDASGIGKLLGEETPLEDAVFYRAFESNGSSLISFLETLISDWEDDTTEKEEEPTVDPRFARGYGVSVRGDADLTFDLGASEEDLRSRLFAYVINENGDQVEYTEYDVIGFDASDSFKGDVTVVFAPGCTEAVPVLIYDHEKVRMWELSLDQEPIIRKGMTFAEVKELPLGEEKYTDGKVNWSKRVSGFVVTRVSGNSFENGVFDQPGDCQVTFTYEPTGREYFCSLLHVGDPDAPRPVKLDYAKPLYLTYTDTEEQVREQLEIFVVYDDGTKVPVTDYAIIMYVPGAREVTVGYVGINLLSVPVCHVENYADYFRFFYPDRGRTLFSKFITSLRTYYVTYKNLFHTVFTTQRTESGRSLRVIVNTEENLDLVRIVNFFFGIPDEKGRRDFDEKALFDYLAALKEEDPDLDLERLFEQVVGVSLKEFVSKLYLDVNVERNDRDHGIGSEIEVVLSDGEDKEYLVTGLSFRLVPSEKESLPSEGQIESARSFEELPAFIESVLKKAFSD